MGLIELVILAVALSMDAFAVSVCLGLRCKNSNIKHYLIPAFYFGFFQALMPAIGYFAGMKSQTLIQNYSNILAFIILILIGANMIKEAFESAEECDIKDDFSFKTMLFLSVATSIDALAVGFTFALLNVKLLQSISIIGFTTFLISIVGVKIGRLFGVKYKRKSEIAGGIILILIGFKVLLQI